MKQLISTLLLIAFYSPATGQHNTYLFIGTYTNGKPATGIYVYKMDTVTGALTKTGQVDSITNPSFLTVAPSGKYLYACTDTKTALTGTISSFAIDSNTGTVKFINRQSSAGANPVNLAVHRSGRFIVNANYTEGNAAVCSINTDGSLNACIQSIAFTDSSINKARQEKSHIHSAVFSPDYNYLYLPDLGSDKIRVFAFNATSSTPLQAANRLAVQMQPGSGPRHFVFHPFKNFAYCIEEMGGSVNAYSYSNGRLTLLQRIPANKKKAALYSSADIHISPDGLFLYCSNRIENTIAIFSIDNNGTLALVDHQDCFGDVPRNFAIDPEGKFLLVANQGSNNVIVFKRDRQTGLLKDTGIQIAVTAPSCLQLRRYTR